MAHRTARTIDAPIGEINMTPLIDVMLVLLIMFILILPVVTHKVPVTLPVGSPEASGTSPPMHRLSVRPNGALFWDGAAIGDTALAPRLEAMATDADRPLLIFEADGAARYERVDELLAIIARSGVERMAFSGNEDFARVF